MFIVNTCDMVLNELLVLGKLFKELDKIHSSLENKISSSK